MVLRGVSVVRRFGHVVVADNVRSGILLWTRSTSRRPGLIGDATAASVRGRMISVLLIVRRATDQEEARSDQDQGDRFCRFFHEMNSQGPSSTWASGEVGKPSQRSYPRAFVRTARALLEFRSRERLFVSHPDQGCQEPDRKDPKRDGTHRARNTRCDAVDGPFTIWAVLRKAVCLRSSNTPLPQTVCGSPSPKNRGQRLAVKSVQGKVK